MKTVKYKATTFSYLEYEVPLHEVMEFKGENESIEDCIHRYGRDIDGGDYTEVGGDWEFNGGEIHDSE